MEKPNHNEAMELAYCQIEKSNLARAYVDLRKKVRLCEWTEDTNDGSWDAACGGKFCIENGTPADNNMTYCCYCGGVLVTPNAI